MIDKIDIQKRTLVFAPKNNTGSKKDATGAFQPESQRFMKFWNIPNDKLFLINNKNNNKNKKEMAMEVIDILCDHPNMVNFIFACHGYRTGMQFGFNNGNVEDLCREIDHASMTDAPNVVFYSCDVARDADKDRKDDLKEFGGDGGFCDQVRDHLCELGSIWCEVIGHSSTGHTMRNPNVMLFEGEGIPYGGYGGRYMVHRSKPALWKKWVAALKTNFRYQFPMMTQAEIYDFLIGFKL